MDKQAKIPKVDAAGQADAEASQDSGSDSESIAQSSVSEEVEADFAEAVAAESQQVARELRAGGAASSSSSSPSSAAAALVRQASAVATAIEQPEMASHEALAIKDLRQDIRGYVFSPESSHPLGRIYATTARVRQFHVSCYCAGPRHSKCNKWISSAKVPDERRILVWIARQKEFDNSAQHLTAFARIVGS